MPFSLSCLSSAVKLRTRSFLTLAVHSWTPSRLEASAKGQVEQSRSMVWDLGSRPLGITVLGVTVLATSRGTRKAEAVNAREDVARRVGKIIIFVFVFYAVCRV